MKTDVLLNFSQPVKGSFEAVIKLDGLFEITKIDIAIKRGDIRVYFPRTYRHKTWVPILKSDDYNNIVDRIKSAFFDWAEKNDIDIVSMMESEPEEVEKDYVPF